MQYNQLKIKDKILFDKFLNGSSFESSPYAFANIFIWRSLFKISWVIIEENLCIFFKDNLGSFMYLPPLGNKQSEGLIKKCLDVMDRFNSNKEISRIENVEESKLEFYRCLGYECIHKASDYVYRSDKLSALKGNSYKSKRAAFNYFIKNYQFDYEPYAPKYKNECILLYKDWMHNRRIKFHDPVYNKMLQDSFSAQNQALDNYQRLNLIGRIVKIDNQVVGYTFGFKLNKDIFCILFETTDLSVKGISQFIFRKIAEELNDYKYINVMDDSGLENLRRLKLSYRPDKLIPSYIVKRKSDAKRY